MRADITRSTYKPAKRFNSVRMQQGRVQLDADWNEQLDIQRHLDRTTDLDVIGAAGAPEVGGGFQVGVTPGGHDLSLTPGRMYVDGILCENLAEEVAVVTINNQGCTLATLLLDGNPLRAGQWLEISVPAQGQPPTVTQVQIQSITNGQITFVQPVTTFVNVQQATARRLTTYLTQPDDPAPFHSDGGSPPSLQLNDGTYFAYLDVWDRSLTATEDPSIKELALAGPDTAFRTKTVWQLELFGIPAANVAAGCAADFPEWEQLVNPLRGTMAARSKAPDQASGDPICILPAGSRYNGLENQLYRVEIHTPGYLDGSSPGRPKATFKWSRENGSVEAIWTDQSGSEMKVSSVGRDGVLGFTGAGSIELIDDAVELSGLPDAAGLITGYTVPDDTTLLLPAGSNTGKLPKDRLDPRVRRWENAAEIAISNTWIPLERGVEVRFGDDPNAFYHNGDYWLIPARTPNGLDGGDVEWPVDPSVIPVGDPTAKGTPLQRQPDGILHHFCKLATVTKAGPNLSVTDCRLQFPSLTTLDAEDIAFTGTATCVGAGPTVESALEFLCDNTEIPGHNLHLHGTGIVCGLQVQCGGDNDLKTVQLKAGYAIAPDGAVVEFTADPPAYDLINAVDTYDGTTPPPAVKIITDQPKQGDGEASLYLGLDNQNKWVPFVEPYDPNQDTPLAALNGTFLTDLYKDCIKKLQDWLNSQLTDSGNTGPASKADQLRAALINLGAQVVNPNSGQNIFLSLREHNLLLAFYTGLKQQLQSHTFCAMFANARVYPDYSKFPTLNNIGMDTIFGKGQHTRLRLRPGANEAYTVGPGLNPLIPSTTLNRYDLAQGKLVSVIDALTGVDLSTNPATSSGAGSVQDVAFLGTRIWLIIPTRDGQNTILRWGVFVGSAINWDLGGWTTICNVKLLTLATTADANTLYAVGQGAQGGLYKIDLSNLAHITATRLVTFTALGDLQVIDSHAYATEGNASTGAYTNVHGINLTTNAELPGFPVAVTGRDGIALAPNTPNHPTLYVASDVIGQGNSVTKYVKAYNMNDGSVIGNPTGTAVFGGAFQMANFVPTGQLLMAVQGDYSLRLLKEQDNTVAAQYLLPMQVDPVAVASDGTNAYVLNYTSNTITTITQAPTLLSPTFPTAQLLADLAAYRAAALEAFADLVGGFAQYLKDCFCDHFLVNCPDQPAQPKIYLAAVRIRGNKVDKICNLTKRRYVKTFPTVGYWLSLFPIIPLVKWAIARFCCTVLPDRTSEFTAKQGGSGTAVGQPGSNPIETLQEWLGRSQGTNALGQLGNAFAFGGSTSRMAVDSFLPVMGHAPSDGPVVATGQPATARVAGGGAIAGRSTAGAVKYLTDSGVTAEVLPYQPSPDLFVASVGSSFATIAPGDTVTLYEEAGTVRAYTTQPQGPSADVQRQVSSLNQSLQAKDAQITQLHNQLTAMQVQQAQLVATQRQHLDSLNQLRAIVESRGGGPTPPAGGPPAGGPPSGGPPAGGPPVGGPIVGGPPGGGPVVGGRGLAVPTAAGAPSAGSAAVSVDPIQSLLAATLVRIDRISFHQSGFGPIGAGNRERTNVCLPKAAGQLGFAIDTVRDLGLAPQYQMQVNLQGRIAGAAPTGEPIIEWSIDQIVGKQFSLFGVGVHVDAVVGTAGALVRPVSPPQTGQDCQGQPRNYSVALSPDPQSAGRLTAHARALGMEMAIELSNITITGSAGT